MGTNIDPATRTELIRKKAEELFVKRGKVPGREMDDWLQAEKLVDQELRAKSPTPSPRVEPKATPAPAAKSSPPPRKVGKFNSVSG